MKPEITVILRVNAKHQRENMEAVYEGFKTLGIPAVFQGANVPIKTKRAAIWGWRLGEELRAKGHDILVCEHGYISDRFKYTSLGWNGLNGHATHAPAHDDNGERFRAIGGVIHPWKYNPDAPVLLLGQLKNDQSLQGLDIEKTYNEWVKKIGKPVIYRPHPVGVQRGVHINVKGVEMSQGTLYEALDNCSYALAFNSNSLVDALMYGVPAVAMDRGSMVYEICGKGLNHVIRPDREETLHKLAWTQWTLEEIATGKPLERLFNEKLHKPLYRQ
jgi:hypothetical protein